MQQPRDAIKVLGRDRRRGMLILGVAEDIEIPFLEKVDNMKSMPAMRESLYASPRP